MTATPALTGRAASEFERTALGSGANSLSRTTPVAETRSIDDQGRVAPAGRSGEPGLLVRDASSPVRLSAGP